MKQQIQTLSQLARLRGMRVNETLSRIQYQEQLCRRYRANIEGLSRLCEYVVNSDTFLQRDNQQRYKGTLHSMLAQQRRELAVAEESLGRIRGDLMLAMRNEKVIAHVLAGKIAQWQQALAVQEQKIQDGLAAQSWWRMQGAGGV